MEVCFVVDATCRHVSAHNDYRMHRGMSRPFFAKDRISDFEIFEKHSMQVVSLLKSRFDEGYSVEFQVRLWI